MEREVDSLMLKGAGRTFSREGVGGGGWQTPKYQWWLGDREYISGNLFVAKSLFLNTFKEKLK